MTRTTSEPTTLAPAATGGAFLFRDQAGSARFHENGVSRGSATYVADASVPPELPPDSLARRGLPASFGDGGARGDWRGNGSIRDQRNSTPDIGRLLDSAAKITSNYLILLASPTGFEPVLPP